MDEKANETLHKVLIDGGKREDGNEYVHLPSRFIQREADSASQIVDLRPPRYLNSRVLSLVRAPDLPVHILPEHP